MLRELHISNLAVIEDAAIELVDGLNCFTGQTGAGKSLIIGAFELLLGLRSGGDLLRDGADEGRVSGLFELRDANVRQLVGQMTDQDLHEGDQLLITRKLFASGRTSVSINGLPATAPMVRTVGELLVDIHGQHDHQYLLKPSNQLLILDQFADTLALRRSFGDRFAQLRELRQRRAELQASRELRRQQRELYEFQADEIDAAQPVADEHTELTARHLRLSNAQKIATDAGVAHQALYESEGSVVERLQMIAQVLIELAELDEEASEIAEQVRTATLSLQEASYDLSRYVNRLELDPAELADVEDRLNTLNRLASKYARDEGPGEDPIAGVLAYREQIGAELDRLRHEDEDLSQIDKQMAELANELKSLGSELRAARQAAAAKLKPGVEGVIRELGMPDAELDVAFTAIDLDAMLQDGDGDGAGDAAPLASPGGLSGGATGLDRIEIMVRTNPGQAARPMRKIASGGELSRIMLAVKSILAGHDRISVLVFDEIDANIGGRMGTVIGQKLRDLTRLDEPAAAAPKKKGGSKGKSKKGNAKAKAPQATPGHQVLCITHLPQIAAFADQHLRIAKEVTGSGKSKQTRTTVSRLAGDDRIDELAEMLTGKDITDTTRKQVREMIATAEQ